VLKNLWRRNVLPAFTHYPPGSAAAHMEFELLGAKAKKPDAPTVATTNEETEVKRKCLVRSQMATASTIFIAKLDRVFRPTEDLTEFSPNEKHVFADSYGVSLPDNPWGEGRNQVMFLSGLCRFVCESASFLLRRGFRKLLQAAETIGLR
jgi:hypothetical protein